MTEKNSSLSTKYVPVILSGLLLGLSLPNSPFLPLGFLAWVWLVPLLLELRNAVSFRAFFGKTLVALGVAFVTIMFWVTNATPLGFLIAVLVGIAVYSVPFLWLFAARRAIGWNSALWTLPVVWTGWEWLFHRSEISLGTIQLAHTQSEFYWLVQFIDLTGASGIAFWLVLLNVSIVRAAEKVREEKSQVIARRGAYLLPVLLFVLPLVYSAFVFLKPEVEKKQISVLAVQPDVTPWLEARLEENAAILGKIVSLTDRALKAQQPDLIVWVEAAVPFDISREEVIRKFLGGYVNKWHTPVLTGIFMSKENENGLTQADESNLAIYNSAVVLSPEALGTDSIKISDLYGKRRLIPFVERAPYNEQFPFVKDWIIKVGVRPDLSLGQKANPLPFNIREGETAQAGMMICYEQVYGAETAEVVRNGAQFLAAITNEGWFGSSHGQYQLASFSRLRNIETRRATIRVGSTGVSWITDRLGRVTKQVPAWSEQILTGNIELSDEQTIYVRYIDYFPKLCAFLSVLLFIAIIGRYFLITLG
ncbi:MAG: apolipoprotein N-acyltransferase [Acidobacteriota bacterium]|nr:apolipoprotein N-acyltransferase [Acidobacteriota bacterium]